MSESMAQGAAGPGASRAAAGAADSAAVAGRPTRRVASDLGKVLAGELGDQLVGLLRGMLIPLLVTPARYGLWRVILLVWQYGAYLHAGSFALLNRELPGLLAGREARRVSEMRQTAFWGTMALSTLVALGLIAFSLSSAAGTDPASLWALRLSAVGLIAQQIFIYVMVDFRVRSRFGSWSLLGFCRAVAALLFMIPLAWVAGVPGLAAGMALAAALAAAVFGRRAGFEPPRLRPRAFLGQVVEGIPLSGLPLLNTAIGSVGPIVAAALLGLEATGFYGLGAMIGSVAHAVPRGLGMVLYPRYLESYASVGERGRIGPLLRRSLRVTSTVSTLAAAAAAIALAPLYHQLFPSYLPGLGATYALVAMMPFLAYSLVLQNALLALRLHKEVITLQLAAVTLSAALATAGALLTHSVTAVAIGVMLATVSYGFAALWLALSHTATSRSPLTEVASELAPVAVIGAATLALLFLWRSSGSPAARNLVALGQLFALSPVALFYGLRAWRNLRDAEE